MVSRKCKLEQFIIGANVFIGTRRYKAAAKVITCIQLWCNNYYRNASCIQYLNYRHCHPLRDWRSRELLRHALGPPLGPFCQHELVKPGRTSTLPTSLKQCFSLVTPSPCPLPRPDSPSYTVCLLHDLSPSQNPNQQ